MFKFAQVVLLLGILYIPSGSYGFHTIPYAEPRPFLNGLPQYAIDEYWTTTGGWSKTLRQIRNEELNWAQKYGVRRQYEDFIAKYEDAATMKDKMILSFLESLPRMYKEFVIYNDDKTANQIWQNNVRFRTEFKQEHKVIQDVISMLFPRNS